MGNQISFLSETIYLEEPWHLVNGATYDSSVSYSLEDSWLLIDGKTLETTEDDMKPRELIPDLKISHDRLRNVMIMWRISELDALELIHTVELTQNGESFNQVGPSIEV